jgi:cystathionine beta-lyase
MEMPDFAALRTMADKFGAYLGFDNSWASPILCRPIEHGADIVIEALTKYLSGHSDLLMGSISVASEELAQTIHAEMRALGIGVSPDDCGMVLRGIESAAVRIAHVGKVAFGLAARLEAEESIDRVLHPGLPTSAGYHLWRRYFDGASGVFSILMKPELIDKFARRFDALSVFRLGASWGGTHSVLGPMVINDERTINRSYVGRHVIRVSVGLESKEELERDLLSCVEWPRTTRG